MKWFSPKTASKVKERALEVGLLSLKNGALIPGFDVDSVRLPHAFKPSENFLESQENSGKNLHLSRKRFRLSKSWSSFPQTPG
ncbi:MAG: DUF2240 family protein [Methanosarcina barkeri]|nr:DUF2240 family protein [Methanosarcina sp. ERenArc_MAG2]